MKKMKMIALLLVATLLLSGTAMAAEGVDDVAENDKAKITIKNGDTEVVFDETYNEMMKVTVTGGLVAGDQYVILMVKHDDLENYNTYEIGEETILFIDQAEADENKSISFDVYPSSMQDGVILIAGADGGPLVLAIVDGKYVLGDVNGDKKVDLKDLTRLARYIASDPEATVSSLDAIDINGDGAQDLKDLVRLARHIADGTAMGKEK